MAINTGTPGFDIDGKTYEFDVGDPNAPGIQPVITERGDLTVDNNPKDISKPTKTTLGQYLSDLTTGKQGASKGTPNAFPIDPPGAGGEQEIDLSDPKGSPTPLSDTTNSSHFSSRNNSSGVSTMSPDLQSGRFSPPTTQGASPVMPDVSTDPAAQLGGKVAKGKTTQPGVNGNVLLSSVAKNNLPPAIRSYVSTALSFNRFTDASMAAPSLTGLGNDAKPVSGEGLIQQPEFNPSLNHPRFGSVSTHRLAQIGTSLSLRASQELNASQPNNNPTNGDQQGAALLPSANQLGTSRVNSVLLEAADVLKDLTTSEIPLGDLTSFAGSSWGSLNNVDDPFSGIDAIGMIALASALTAAIVLLFEGLGFLLGLIKGDSTDAARTESGRYVLGRYLITKGADPNAFPPSFPPNIGQLLGIRTTVFPLSTALQAGTAAFFGIDTTTFGTALSSGLKSSASSPGFNAIVARTIIRSSIVVGDAFKKTFNSTNVVSGIENVLGIVDSIRSSKLIAAVNVFASLGDAVLTDPGDVYDPPDGLPEEPSKKSKIDSFSDTGPMTTIQKNRLRGSLKLAWSSNRAPAMYLIPDSVLSMQVADNKLGGFKGASALVDPSSRTTQVIQTSSDQQANGSRISPDKVIEMEQVLDGEYMPFYFHDLRTNEIISFHAFLASLTEDYAPAWEKVEGFGRVDSVKIYKHTGRRIALSFYIAATSESDFDDMWVKVNKLITLVYPQYTQGRTLTNGVDTTFVQPFSQMIGASPLIRMRLGDLIRSNYSRFALARLFGAADGTMTLPDTTGAAQNVQFGGASDKMTNFLIDARLLTQKVDPTNRFTCDVGGWKLQPSALGGLISSAQSLAGTAAPDQAPSFNIDGADMQYFEFEIIATTGVNNTQSVCKPHLMNASDISRKLGIGAGRASDIAAMLDSKYNNTSIIKQKVVGSNGYAIPFQLLKPAKDTLDALFRQNFFGATETETTNIDMLSDFLDPEKNALVKAFKQVQGKGLAGTIDSLNFDWHEHITWDDRVDHRAPKMCKVTMAFDVIHDISPGIDHLGYNRSPVYPVGAGMRMGKDQK